MSQLPIYRVTSNFFRNNRNNRHLVPHIFWETEEMRDWFFPYPETNIIEPQWLVQMSFPFGTRPASRVVVRCELLVLGEGEAPKKSELQSLWLGYPIAPPWNHVPLHVLHC